MRLFVDYTNWKGRREWREIIPFEGDEGKPHIGKYCEEGHEPFETWIIQVYMVDRNHAQRSLRMSSIHGFKVI